uniref:Oxidoreductase N-terminal domain-containing protein n=1 Tax=Oryza brachyantha TaxID=4533 RepID=J3NC95_ORYBR
MEQHDKFNICLSSLTFCQQLYQLSHRQVSLYLSLSIYFFYTLTSLSSLAQEASTMVSTVASRMVSNRRAILKRYAVRGLPSEYNIEVVTTMPSTLALSAGPSMVVVKSLYISCDPYVHDLSSDG